MIKNPSQYQINLAEQAGDFIVARQLPFTMKLFDKFMQLLTGIEPNMVTYKDEQYDSRTVVIYSKAEMYSFMQRGIDGTLHNIKNPNIKIDRKFDINANINFVIIELGKETFKVDFFDLYNLLTDVKNKYDNLIENPKASDYKEISKTQITIYKDDEYIYEFVNGFALNLVTVQNIKSNKIKVYENTFGLESEEFNTEKEAHDNISDLLKIRIDIALNNPLINSRKLVKRERIGENNSIEI